MAKEAECKNAQYESGVNAGQKRHSAHQQKNEFAFEETDAEKDDANPEDIFVTLLAGEREGGRGGGDCAYAKRNRAASVVRGGGGGSRRLSSWRFFWPRTDIFLH